MSNSIICCVFSLVTVLSRIPSGCTETISKSVCLEDSVELFQNISLANCTISIYRNHGNASMHIATWFMQGSIIQPSADQRHLRIVSFDNYGSIWMLNVRNSDEGRYTLASRKDTHTRYLLHVDIVVLRAPSVHCKPIIKSVDTYLLAFLEANDCGKPAASVYWLGYKKQTKIQLQPEEETGAYHACIEGPSLRCTRKFNATGYCSSFRTDADEKQTPEIPRISLIQGSITDRSIVLQCQLTINTSVRPYWKRNGIPINSNAKYSQTDNSLTIRHVNVDDQYVIYTCISPGSRIESDPYSIETSGPTFIRVKQNIMMVKEHDEWNVSCLTDCYPLCSVEWSKFDPSTGQKDVLFEQTSLQITNIRKEMSGNYSCKIQNLITDAFLESSLSLNVLYGPDHICLNTSSNIIEVDEFDSVTILCTAECFPPCLFFWIETYTRNRIQNAELKLVNMSTDGTYTCQARNPKLNTATISKTINITVNIDETLIPRIAIVRFNVSNHSIVLKCSSFRMSSGKFYWMVNGSVIKNSDRYSTDNFFLSVRHLTAEIQYNSYTCREPGSNLHSDPFWIKAHGPTFIEVSPKNVVVKEHNGLNISCLADCYPLCSLQWFKLDPFSIPTNIVSEENVFEIRDVTRMKSGNYSCKVQNIITGSFKESSFSLAVIYGPDIVIVNTSKSRTEVYQFSSIALFCFADCFPPCLFRWSFSYTDTVIEGAKLEIVNVTFNGSLTCHARNPINMNVTVSDTVNIMVMSEENRHTISSKDKDKDTEEIPFVRYLMYVIPGTAGAGLMLCVGFYFLSKVIYRQRVAEVSDNIFSEPSVIGESLQVETLTQHYWTIVPNARGEFSTAIDSDINLQLEDFIEADRSESMKSEETTYSRHQIADQLEMFSHQLQSEHKEIETNCLEALDIEGYISPVLSDHLKFNEYIDPIPSDPVECNEFIHPIHSDPVLCNQYIHSIPSDSVNCNEYIHPIPSDPFECNEYIHQIPSDSTDLDRHIDYIPSDSKGRNRSLYPIPPLHCERDGCYNPTFSCALESDTYNDPTPSENLEWR